MKLLVPVKVVSVLDEEVELDGLRPDPEAVEWELNEWDAFSLEAALRLAEAEEGSEVVVACACDREVADEAEEALRECLAKGADRAALIADDALAGADPLAVARVLAALAEREAPDLVLCGAQSSDAAQGATAAALAGYLDLPRVAVVNLVELADGELTVGRELEGGLVELLRLRPPALLSLQTGTNEPRYANLRAIKQARSKPLEELSLGELGLGAEAIEAASGSRTVALAPPEKAASASMIEGDPDAVAARVLEIVEEAMAR